MIWFTRRTTKSVALIGSVLAAAAGCADVASTPSSQSPQYMYDRVAEIRNAPAMDDVLQPPSLAEAMPHQDFVVDTGKKEVKFAFSDAVVSGKVTSAVEGNGYIYSESDDVEIVNFNDPAAQARDIVVTVAADETVGAPADDVEFRMGVLDGSDPEEFLASMRGVGDTVVVLEEIRTGLNSGDLTPVMNGALIGQVADGGAVKFPALGPQEDEFVGVTDTVEEILDEASSNPPTQDYEYGTAP